MMTHVNLRRSAGLVCLYPDDDARVTGVDIYVYELAARRRGVARSAVAFAVDAARARGVTALHWRCFVDNEPSLALARACGFALDEVARCARHLGNGAVDEARLSVSLAS